VQEVTDVGDDLQRVRGGEPMPVVDLRGEEAAVVGTEELQTMCEAGGTANATLGLSPGMILWVTRGARIRWCP
jgi:hypothetical protein